MLPTKSVAQENPKAALDKMFNDFAKVAKRKACNRYENIEARNVF